MTNDITELIQTLFAYFAEMEFESSSHDAFRDAANRVFAEEGFEVTFDVDDGELVTCNE